MIRVRLTRGITKIRTKCLLLLQTLTKTNSDLEASANFRKDCPFNPMIGYLNINSIRNKIVYLTAICKTSPLQILCIDERNWTQVSQMRKFMFLITSFHVFGGTEIYQEVEK